jgi:pimeloyl-ACP methyl ester carboxylesterase
LRYSIFNVFGLFVNLKKDMLNAINGRPLLSISRTQNIRFIHLKNDVLDYDLFTPKTNTSKPIPPIIFLHGLLGNRKNNRSSARQLAEQLETPFIVPDLRNHGTSFHAEPMNYKTMSDDITKLIENLPSTISRHQGFIILGHSMGAKVAMIHALRFPNLVKGVVSIDNIPYQNPEDSFIEFEKFHIALHTLNWCVKKHPEWTLNEVKSYLIKYVEPAENIVNFWLTNIVEKNGKLSPKIPFEILNRSVDDVLHWKMEQYGDLDQFSHQKNIAPLLIIKANYSKFIGSDIHTHAIAKFFPDYHVKPIDAGHWIVTERKNDFIKIVKDWVSERFIA